VTLLARSIIRFGSERTDFFRYGTCERECGAKLRHIQRVFAGSISHKTCHVLESNAVWSDPTLVSPNDEHWPRGRSTSRNVYGYGARVRSPQCFKPPDLRSESAIVKPAILVGTLDLPQHVEKVASGSVCER